MELLRTPDEAFATLTDFTYEPRRATVRAGDGAEAEMAWVQDGPADGPLVLLLHGEPTWSYLYRTMIPILADAGCRAVAPDLIGFGRSDKPADVADHSYLRHVEWVRSFVVDVLGADEITLFGQDWGGLIGLRLVAENPELFARVVASNTGLPTGDQDMPDVWHAFRRAVRTATTLDVGRFVAGGCTQGLDDTARAAYDAPFPDESYKAGPRVMPDLVPTRPDDPATEANRAAWTTLRGFEKPFLVAFGDSDPITGAMGPVLKRMIPGATGLDHPVITGAGHFVQEDAGPELARVIVDLVRS